MDDPAFQVPAFMAMSDPLAEVTAKLPVEKVPAVRVKSSAEVSQETAEAKVTVPLLLLTVTGPLNLSVAPVKSYD